MTLIPPPRTDTTLRKRRNNLRRTALASAGVVGALALVSTTGLISLANLTASGKGDLNSASGLQHMNFAAKPAATASPQAERRSSLTTAATSRPSPAHPTASAAPKPATESPSSEPSAKPSDACPSGDYSGSVTDQSCGERPSPLPAPAAPPQTLSAAAADKCPAGDYSASRFDGTCGQAPPHAEVKLVQATSSLPGKYYCAMWWDGTGTGEISSGGRSVSETGEQTGTGATFSAEPGTRQTCTFTLNGRVVATKAVLVNTQ